MIIYPDSGHGGIFQFHDKFAPVVAEFLGQQWPPRTALRKSRAKMSVTVQPQMYVRKPWPLHPAVDAHRPAPVRRDGPLEGTSLEDHLGQGLRLEEYRQIHLSR